MYAINTNPSENGSVLASLRGLIPNRRCSFTEALRIAELQATRLRALLGVDEDAFPTELLAELPRVRVEQRDGLPFSGASYWTKGAWTIALNRSEPWQRRRLTLLHEFKHIVDHGRAHDLYLGLRRVSSEQQAEQAADYFAGCALMPKTLLKRAWAAGLQRPAPLAEQFAVSQRAVEVRLAQVGLTGGERCSRHRASPTPGRYFRQLSIAWHSQHSVRDEEVARAGG